MTHADQAGPPADPAPSTAHPPLGGAGASVRSRRGDGARLTALLLENVHPVADGILAEAGIDVHRVPGALDEGELADALQDVDLVGIRSKTRVTADVLDKAPHLLAVGAFCIGTNQIDLESAAARGVAAFNAPFSNTRSVVELAIAEIIALTRRLTEKDDALHAGVWDKSAKGAHEVRGRRLGIIGYGNIGSQLSVIAEALGMSVCFYDVSDKLAMGNAQRRSTMAEVLAESDVVSLHVDGRPGNAGIFGDAEFRQMKPGALFLNLSRGFVAEPDSLRAHIESGHLAGAAIDVFPVEPKAQGEPFDSALRGLPNVILTPHIGGSTEEAQEDIGRFVAGKLADYVGAGATTLSVNLPNVTLEHTPGTHRLAHLHRNVPGVLARVNQVLADRQVNVEGQLLTTRGELGYLLTDVRTDYTPDVIAELEGLPETVSLRILD